MWSGFHTASQHRWRLAAVSFATLLADLSKNGEMHSDVSDYYTSWALDEAAGVSPIYESWARGVAEDSEVIALIAELPRNKRQPNLVFASARNCGAPVGPYGPFRDWLLGHWDAVRRVILSHSTQTNEVGRCAVLLPLLSRLPQPLALIEVGASAGLCLYPERYSYEYQPDGDSNDAVIRLDPPTGASAVVNRCRINRSEAIPTALPDVHWRAGIDLNPLDVSDDQDVRWLEQLIWPEHEHRRRNLRAAAALVAPEKPHVVKGDLLEALPALLNQVPNGCRPVVFHSAVLAYLDADLRSAFVDLMRSHPEVIWLSNEGAAVLPEIGGPLATTQPGAFVVAQDGEARAVAGPHGQFYRAL